MSITDYNFIEMSATGAAPVAPVKSFPYSLPTIDYVVLAVYLKYSLDSSNVLNGGSVTVLFGPTSMLTGIVAGDAFFTYSLVRYNKDDSSAFSTVGNPGYKFGDVVQVGILDGPLIILPQPIFSLKYSFCHPVSSTSLGTAETPTGTVHRRL